MQFWRELICGEPMCRTIEHQVESQRNGDIFASTTHSQNTLQNIHSICLLFVGLPIFAEDVLMSSRSKIVGSYSRIQQCYGTSTRCCVGFIGGTCQSYWHCPGIFVVFDLLDFFRLHCFFEELYFLGATVRLWRLWKSIFQAILHYSAKEIEFRGSDCIS